MESYDFGLCSGIPGLLLFCPSSQLGQPAHHQPASLVSMCTFGLLAFGFPQLWLRFGPCVLPALKNSSPHWPYRTQDKAIRAEGWTLISMEFVWAHDFRDHISLGAAALCADGQSQQQCAAMGSDENLNRKYLLSCEVWLNENDSLHASAFVLW